ncbi:MAG: hypothetical protein JWR69_4600 [Pedosphaera sp.]|nr:hypothetical protein [Pedosphaera sp.]
MSLAGVQAAEQQKKASGPDYYNLAVGPVSLRFQSEMGVEFNDNVNYSSTGKQADIGLRPGMNVRALWPVTEQNSLYFSTGIGYIHYLQTPTLDHLYITPDSNLAFKMYAGDFVINYHDRFSITEDVAQSPTISGTGNFGQIENTLGVGVDWDLNQLILSFGYDHDSMWATASRFQRIDHSSELFNLRAAFAVRPTTTAGFELGGGLTAYDQKVLNDNTHFSIGPFYQAQLSQHFSTKLSAGFVSYSFSTNGTVSDLHSLNSFYADASFTHHVNRWFDHAVSVGHQFQVGTSSSLVDLYYARYQANWNLFREVPFSTHLTYSHGEESGGTSQVFDQYDVGFSVAYQITQKLAGTVSYDLLLKNSNLPFANYVQNRLVFDFRYSF